jgi:hypothetical protein
MREIATFATAFDGNGERNDQLLRSLLIAMSKKFVAEQMHAIGPSHLARVLFLESVIGYEPHNRRIYALRDANRSALTRTNLFARMASDFFMHHELGHVAEADDRFDRFIEPTIEAFCAEYPSKTRDGNLLHREARADLFALNCCFSIYAPNLAETNLRSYFALLIHAVTALNVLYATAHDLHRLNVDPSHCGLNIEREFELWADRQSIMARYVDDFVFDDRTVPCAHVDEIGPIPVPEGFNVLTDTEAVLTFLSEDTRRVSELISFGFRPEGNGFEDIISGSRVGSVLKDKKRRRRAVSFTGLAEREG